MAYYQCCFASRSGDAVADFSVFDHNRLATLNDFDWLID